MSFTESIDRILGASWFREELVKRGPGGKFAKKLGGPLAGRIASSVDVLSGRTSEKNGRVAKDALDMAEKARGHIPDEELLTFLDQVNAGMDGKLPNTPGMKAAVRVAAMNDKEIDSLQPSGDSHLAALFREMGDEGPPSVVSREDMDALVSGGDHVELFRGVRGVGDLTAGQIHEGFRTAEPHYQGVGVHGNGTYFSGHRETAGWYAGFPSNLAPDEPGVLRVAAGPSVRTIDFSSDSVNFPEGPGGLRDSMARSALVRRAAYLANVDRLAEGVDIPETSPDVYRLTSAFRKLNGLLDDPGRWAAAEGYDAIRVTGHPSNLSDRDFWVVLRRNRLVAERAPGVKAASFLAAASGLFDDILHPRGAGGRFAKKAGGAAGDVADGVAERTPAERYQAARKALLDTPEGEEAFDLLGRQNVDVDEHVVSFLEDVARAREGKLPPGLDAAYEVGALSEDQLGSKGFGSDGALRAILDRTEERPPRIVGHEELDALTGPGGGHTEMFRGVERHGDMSPERIHDDFRQSDHNYIGTGVHGNGLYFTTAEGTARSYASSPEGVVRVGLGPDANVADARHPHFRHTHARDQLVMDVATRSRWAQAKSSGDDAADDIAVQGRRARTILRDPGRWAATKGYDAIRIDWDDESYFVLLRRNHVAATPGPRTRTQASSLVGDDVQSIAKHLVESGALIGLSASAGAKLLRGELIKRKCVKPKTVKGSDELFIPGDLSAIIDSIVAAGWFKEELIKRGPGGKFAKKLGDVADKVDDEADGFAALQKRLAAEEAAKGIIRNADGAVIKYPADGVEPYGEAVNMGEARMFSALSRHADADGDFAGYDASESMEDARISAINELRKDATDGTPSVFMREEHFDRLLNGEGRVKSQFETNWSSGAYNNDLRNRYEGTHVIGIDPGDKIAPSARPIYGALTNDDDREYGTLARTYGQVELQLHDSVLDRSTLTFGDSLNGNLFAIPARRAPQLSDERLLAAAGPDYIGYTVDNMAGMQDFSEGRPYRELQVHGGVTLDDVRNVHFHRGRLSGEWEFERDRTEIKRKLTARKISYTED